MTTRLPIVAPIPPFKGGPLQARNAPNTQSHTQAHSSPAKPSQPQPSKPKATTRLEREKKKEFKDPKNIGPWDLGKLIGQGASGELLRPWPVFEQGKGERVETPPRIGIRMHTRREE